MRNSNTRRLNWCNSKARSSFNRLLRRWKMRSSVRSNCPMKFSILGELMHTELRNLLVRASAIRVKSSPSIHSYKAAEDSRTPRRWRVFSHTAPSAKFWSAAVLCRFHRKLGKLINAIGHRWRAVISALIVLLLAFIFLPACSQKSAEAAGAPNSEKKEESRVTHGTNGETVIKLDAETQKLMGLQTAALSPAELSPEIKGYGRVLETAPLASLVADLTVV